MSNVKPVDVFNVKSGRRFTPFGPLSVALDTYFNPELDLGKRRTASHTITDHLGKQNPLAFHVEEMSDLDLYKLKHQLRILQTFIAVHRDRFEDGGLKIKHDIEAVRTKFDLENINKPAVQKPKTFYDRVKEREQQGRPKIDWMKNEDLLLAFGRRVLTRMPIPSTLLRCVR